MGYLVGLELKGTASYDDNVGLKNYISTAENANGRHIGFIRPAAASR